jgi:predicted nucleic acid-binding protein
VIVLDSSVLVDYMRSDLRAHAYLRSISVDHPLTTHPVVIAELLEGVKNSRELRLHAAMWRRAKVVSATEHDLAHGLRLLAKHRLTVGIGWADCFIAATCLRLGAVLATHNVKHFGAVRGLKVVRPY